MQTQLPVEQLQVGMRVLRIDGSWLDHPFLKGAFRIEREEQLAQLRSSRIATVWVQTTPQVKALVSAHLVAQDHLAQSTAPSVDGVSGQHATEPAAQPSSTPIRVSQSQELARAKRILGQSRDAMQSLFQDVRMGKAVNAEHCLPLVDEITESVGRNPGALVSLARLKTSDDYTYLHSLAVCALMVSLAQQLKLSEDEARAAGLAGLVHDLGKAMMPIEVLNKPGKLTAAEFDIMRGHPLAGHRMLEEARGVGPVALDVCLHHHEKMNGTGYPHGLKGEEISLFARMGAVCDVYDAITSNRPYKSGWDPAESVQKMAQWAKEGHFDERIFQAFVKCVGIYPTGSLVRLESGRLAVVVEQSEASLLSPTVRVFYSTKSKEPIPTERVVLQGSADRIVAREATADWEALQLDKLWSLPS